jgi:tetratricopeptide (TPR) repeat protein
MAYRRLNIKAALAGAVIFALIAAGAFVVIRQQNRTPEQFIKDAQAAISQSRSTTDKHTKERLYSKARACFWSAYTRAKTNPLRQEILFKMVDMYIENGQWPFVLGCWNEISTIDPNNVTARLGRLRYLDILGQSGDSSSWQQIYEQASELLEIARSSDGRLLKENLFAWNIPSLEIDKYGPQYLGTYVYMLRGRAAIELSGLGAADDKERMLNRAIDDFNSALKLEPNNIDAYWHLALATAAKGEALALQGNFSERNSAFLKAEALLSRAVDIAPDKPAAQINLLKFRLAVAKKAEAKLQKEQIVALEPQYLKLTDNFKSSPEAFAALSDYELVYSSYSGPAKLDSAIEALEKATALDDQNVTYKSGIGQLYFRRYSIFQRQADIEKTIETAEEALSLPQAQDIADPRRPIRLASRLQLYSLLANSYIELILNNKVDINNPILLAGAEKAIQEIQQLMGSSETTESLKWQGMLELAKGNRKTAIMKLYETYQKLRALKPLTPPWPEDMDFAWLSYNLARLFADSPEKGATYEFLVSALYSGIAETKPQARLDYARLVLEFKRWSAAAEQIAAYEAYAGPSSVSKELRIRTLIGAQQLEEAEKELAKQPPDSEWTLGLRMELNQARLNTDSKPQTQTEEQIIANIAEPLNRMVQLGLFYYRNRDFEKATHYLHDALEQFKKNNDPGQVTNERLAAGCLFEIAVSSRNWTLAEQVIKTARQRDTDQCQGLFFEARLLAANGRFKDAMARTQAALKQNPVSSRLYLLSSQINISLDNETAGLADIRKAAMLNPLDAVIAKSEATTIYKITRNQASAVKITEAKNALERAIVLNPADFELLGLYSDIIAPDEPLRAVAIRQNLFEAFKSSENAALLAKTATEAAEKQSNPSLRQSLLDIAASATGQAKTLPYSKDSTLLSKQPPQKVDYTQIDATAKQQLDKTIEYIEKCINQTGLNDPNITKFKMQKAELLVLAYDRTSDNIYLSSAITEYESLLPKMPNNTNILNNLAFLLAEDNQRLTQALEYSRRAMDAMPDEPGIMETYAFVLYKNGQISQADKFMQDALQQYNRQNKIVIPAVVYEHKGLIKEKLADKIEALAAYKMAIEKGAGNLSQPARIRLQKAIERLGEN